MESVSVLLNIFRPKCEHAAELRTFRILNCSQLESRFLSIQHVSHRKKKKKKKITYLPYLMFFQPLPEPHNYFFLALAKMLHKWTQFLMSFNGRYILGSQRIFRCFSWSKDSISSMTGKNLAYLLSKLQGRTQMILSDMGPANPISERKTEKLFFIQQLKHMFRVLKRIVSLRTHNICVG